MNHNIGMNWGYGVNWGDLSASTDFYLIKDGVVADI